MSILEAAAMRCRTMADGSLRIECEVEPRYAQAAFAMFGSPGTPMALAALKVGHAAKSDEPAAEPTRGGALAKLAGIWCNDAQFLDFIREKYDRAKGGDGNGWGGSAPLDADNGVDWCRLAILAICDIKSRAELDSNSEAAAIFHREIRAPYAKWRIARGLT